MARTRTLTQLRDALADRADVSVAASGVRDTHTVVDARINRAIQRWKLMVAESGDDTFLLTSRTATSASTTRDAANWAPCMYIAQPTAMLFVRGIDIWDGETPIEMMAVDEAQRNVGHALQFDGSGGTGFPVFYRVGGTNNAGSQIIQLFPWADGAYTIDVRYIPAHVDLTTGSDTVDFIAGGEEWVVNDAAMQTLISDGLAGSAAFGACLQWNQKLEAELRFATACRNRPRVVNQKRRMESLISYVRGPL